jgi:hypothetical protein
VERLQSHPSYWLTVVYETSPPGGNVLTPERLAFVARVENVIASVARYGDFCHLQPPPSQPSVAASHPKACARWVPSDIGGAACPNTTCTTPMSLLSFEALIRRWFSEVRGFVQLLLCGRRRTQRGFMKNMMRPDFSSKTEQAVFFFTVVEFSLPILVAPESAW